MPVIFDKVLRQIFMDQGAQPHSAWYILGIAMLLPTIFAMRAIFGYLSGYLMTFSSLEVLRRLKQHIFDRIQSYPIAFFDKFTTGDLLTRLTNDTAAVQTVLLSFSSEIFPPTAASCGGALAFFALPFAFTKGQVVCAALFFFGGSSVLAFLPVQMIRKNMKRFRGKAQVG